MLPSGSTHSISSGAALPDDIRLKCSYYASEVQNQVNSLYEEQHKWLEDHIIKIKETMIKPTHKKDGTRSVIAGIIKTPSCKRNKRLSKKTSKPDQLATSPFKSSNPTHPLSELKRSQLNINSIEIQEIIQQQLERERSEIELRLQQEISTLNHQYQSPVKKSSNGSTLPSADHGNQSPTSIWKPVGSLLSAKSIATSGLCRPSNPTDPFLPLLLPSATKRTGHPEPISKTHDLSFSEQDTEYEQLPVTETRLDLKNDSLTADHLDANDVLATAGHELSAIQEGEEEEDSNIPPPVPPVPQKVLNSPMQLQRPPEASHLSSSTSSPPNKTTSAPLPQSKTVVPLTQDETSTSPPPPPQPQTRLIPMETASLHPNNYATPTEPSQRPALSLDSSEAPETHSTDTGISDSDPIAPQVVPSTEVTSHVEPKLNATVSESQAATSHFANVPPSQIHPIAYPFALLPSAVIAPVTEVASKMAIVSSTSENQPVDGIQPVLSTSSSSTSDGVQLLVTEKNPPPSQLITATSSVKQELEENIPQSPLDDTTRSTGSVQAHIDTVVEVPLNDNPSSLRHNLYASSGSSYSERVIDNVARTPGVTQTNNLFTPGKTRAAVIQSPHSKWSSKPKPFKTPATNAKLGTNGEHEGHRSGFSGSPTEHFPKPFSLLSNMQSTSGQQDLVLDATTTSLTEPIATISSQDFRRSGLKRTSTDAGFYASDSHDAKMSRSHTPGLMNIRSSTTGATGRKGMEDLKSRLSKIQRESAMHERAHHHAPALFTDVSASVNQSLVAHNNAPFVPKTVPLSSSLPSLVPLPKPLTLPITRTLTDEQQDRDRTAEIRSHAPIMHQSFTTSVELLPSTKSQAAHPVDGPIHPHSHSIPSEPLRPSSAVSVKPDGAQVPVVDQLNPQRRNSSGSSASNIVASYETKMNPSATEVPVGTLATVEQSDKLQSLLDITPIQTAAKVESKHIAFLKGITSTLNAPLTSSATILDEPLKNADTEAVESHSLRNSPSPEDNDDRHAQTDTDADEQVHVETVETVLSNPESPGFIPENESGNVSNEDNEDHETQSEQEDQADDDQNEDPSVEIVSSHGHRILSKNAHVELHSSDDDAPNQMQTFNNAMQSEQVKTPRNVTSKATSPVSTGFMGVFKAGAALATSWTASKPKPELKSLQLAAEAAKKDQNERDRKATLKEGRRAMLAEKKQTEEKSKAENEKKARLADAEKKKQEREEASKARTGLKTKIPLHPASGARQITTTEEAAKKRKMDNDSNRITDKKSKVPQQGEHFTATKLPSSTQKPASSYLPSRTAPSAPGSAMKPTSSKNLAGSTSNIKQPTQQHKANPPSRPPSQASQYNGRQSGKNNLATSQLLKSSQASQSQRITSTTATSTTITKNNQKIIKGKMKQTVEKEEYVELPDIDSEYSDDDQSEHERKEAKLPDWAQSPALRQALANQRQVNPDDVFGGSIPPPKMEEIFRDRASKFRHRTSSANWTGADGLTALEEADYAKRMGYHNKTKSSKK